MLEKVEKLFGRLSLAWTSSRKNHCAGRQTTESEMQTREKEQQSVPHMSPDTPSEEVDKASEEKAGVTLTKNWWHAHNLGRTGVPRMHRG